MPDTNVPAKKAFLSNSQYDALKWLALVGLPAVGTLYFTLSGFWHLPSPTEVVGTIMAVDTFLGLILGVSKKNYLKDDSRYDGVLNVDESDTRLIHQLEIQTAPEDLAHKDDITLKVTKVPSE